MMATEREAERRYTAQYGMIQIVICEDHARTKRAELKYIDPFDPSAVCFFCRGGK